MLKQPGRTSAIIATIAFFCGVSVAMLFSSCDNTCSTSESTRTPIYTTEVAVSPTRPLPIARPQHGPEEPSQPLPTIKRRDDLGTMLELDSFNPKIGAELGVQRGHFAKVTLEKWKKAEEYWLVDLWQQQTNYKDQANVGNDQQNQIYREALSNVVPWSSKIKVCRNFTTHCVKTVPNSYLDYIYIDARHDFKGVLVDIDDWWPKLKKNGVFAGHDYIDQDEVGKGQDWTVNYDGTVDTTGTVVRGAVELFFTDSIFGVSEELLVPLRQLIKTSKGDRLRSIKVTYRDGLWVSWYCRK